MGKMNLLDFVMERRKQNEYFNKNGLDGFSLEELLAIELPSKFNRDEDQFRDLFFELLLWFQNEDATAEDIMAFVKDELEYLDFVSIWREFEENVKFEDESMDFILLSGGKIMNHQLMKETQNGDLFRNSLIDDDKTTELDIIMSNKVLLGIVPDFEDIDEDHFHIDIVLSYAIRGENKKAVKKIMDTFLNLKYEEKFLLNALISESEEIIDLILYKFSNTCALSSIYDYLENFIYMSTHNMKKLITKYVDITKSEQKVAYYFAHKSSQVSYSKLIDNIDEEITKLETKKKDFRKKEEFVFKFKDIMDHVPEYLTEDDNLFEQQLIEIFMENPKIKEALIGEL